MSNVESFFDEVEIQFLFKIFVRYKMKIIVSKLTKEMSQTNGWMPRR